MRRIALSILCESAGGGVRRLREYRSDSREIFLTFGQRRIVHRRDSSHRASGQSKREHPATQPGAFHRP